MPPGDAWAALALGHYRFGSSRQTDFPMIDVGVGVTPRAQVGLAVPYYRFSASDGSSLSGVGDVYVNAKLVLVDPATHARRLGVAVAPLVEIQNAPLPGTSRVAFAAPVNVELRADGYRLFGSGGFFSRGAVFGSGAVETPVTERLVLTAAISITRSVKEDLEADLQQIPRNRSDVSAVAAFFLTPTVALFGGTGRTLSGHATATSLLITAGVSVTFTPQMVP
jgi:hypothetical protein